VEHSPVPAFSLDTEYDLQQLVRQLIRDKQILSAHDVSEGGLFQTLCESAFPNELGFSIQLPQGLRADAFLFGESQSRVVVSVNLANRESFLKAVGAFDCLPIGVVTPGEVVVDGQPWGTIQDWKAKHEGAIHRWMSAETSI